MMLNDEGCSSFKSRFMHSPLIHSNRAERLSELAHSLLEWWLKLDEYHAGILYLYREAEHSFVPLCSQGYPEEIAKTALGYSSNQEVFDRLFQERDILTGSHQKTAGFAPGLQKPFIASITLPLSNRLKKIGLLQLIAARPPCYEASELRCLQNFAQESAILLERMEKQEASRNSLHSLNSLFHYLPDAMLVMDDSGRVVRANSAAIQLFGQEAPELKQLSWGDFLKLDEGVQLPERGDGSSFSWFSARLKAGREAGAVATIGFSRFQWDESDYLLLLARPQDVKQGNPQSEPGDLYRAVFDHCADMICVFAESGQIVAINPAGALLLGSTEEEIVGCGLFDFIDDKSGLQARQFVKEEVEKGGCCRQDITVRSLSGHLLELDICVRRLPLNSHDGFLSCIARNITERKELERKLHYKSHHDALTGLFNRHLFDSKMLLWEGGEVDPVGVVICDIDGLKQVNDSGGHLAGDELLKAAARILQESFREGDIIARIGGDEFGILMPRSNWNGLRAALARLDQNIDAYNASGPRWPLLFSRGCAVRYSRFKTLREAMQDADDQMYRQKRGDRKRPAERRLCGEADKGRFCLRGAEGE